MMKSQWFTRNILFSLMCNGRDYERKNMHLMKWDHFPLCYNHQTDCNQWVGVEIKHSLSSHDDRLYLHERNEYAAEVAWCVWLNGFLQRLLVGCQVWEHDVWHVTSSQNNKVILKACFVFFQHHTNHSDKQHSWHVFPHCSWWPGSQSERVHLSQHPDEMKAA